MEGLERLGLASAAVQREHELLAEPLAGRMRCDESLQLAERGPVAAERQVRGDARLEPLQPKLFEAPDLRLREVLECHVRKRRSAPQRERGAQGVRRGDRVAGIELRAALGHPVLEDLRVQISRRDREHVAAAHRPQDGAASGRGLQRGEALAQARDRHLHALERTIRVAGVPQGFVELLAGDPAVGVQQEEGEQGHLPRAAERRAVLAGACLERSEDRERHAPTGRLLDVVGRLPRVERVAAWPRSHSPTPASHVASPMVTMTLSPRSTIVTGVH